MSRKLTPEQARDMAKNRENPGRKPKPSFCGKCGATCPSATEAREHCRAK